MTTGIDLDDAEGLVRMLARRITNSRLRHGQLECPKCGGKIDFSVRKTGHTRGRCRTRDCVTWDQVKVA